MKTVCRTRIKDRIARVLLNAPSGGLSKYRVAKLAGAGYPWTHALLRRLAEQGLVSGTRVIDPEGMFAWWRRWRPPFDRRDYMVRRPLAMLAESSMPHAVTTYVAENRIQEYLFPSRTDVYIRAEDRAKWHDLIVRDGLVGGGNLRLLFGDDHVFHGSRSLDGITIASVPQVIADLYDAGGSCIEAADMLLARARDNGNL